MDSRPPNTQASSPSALLQGLAALAGGELLARVAGFIATAVLARRLGPDGFGVIGFALALCGYLNLAVNSGMNDIAAREVARAPDRARQVYAGVTTVRLILASGAVLVLAAVVWFLPKPAAVQLVVLLSGLSFFSYAVDPSWVFKGLESSYLEQFVAENPRATIGDIVVLITETDFRDAQHKDDPYLRRSKPLFRMAGQELERAPYRPAVLDFLMDQSRLVWLANSKLASMLAPLPLPLAPGVPVVEATLAAARDLARAKGARLHAFAWSAVGHQRAAELFGKALESP